MARCSCRRRPTPPASSAASRCWRPTSGTNPDWALFALKNNSDAQIERLLVAPFFRLPGSGVFRPDLGNDRIKALTPSQGVRPTRLVDGEADVYDVTVDPGATVTFVAELSSGTLPELYMWKPDAYRDYVNSFTLFRGVVLGISSLGAVFLTIMFAVKGRGIFPATAAFAWAVLIYLLIDFGVFGRLLGIGNGHMQPYRAASEALIATTLFGFLFIYLNLHRWHLRFIHLALALAAVFVALLAFAFFQPAIAATVARLVLALLGLSGFFLILLLALRGYDRARAAGADLDHLHRLAVLFLDGADRPGLQRRGAAGRRRRPRAHGDAARLHLGAARLRRRAGLDRHAQRGRAPGPGADRVRRLRLRLEHRARPGQRLRGTGDPPRRTPGRTARRHQAMARPHPPGGPRPFPHRVRHPGGAQARQGFDPTSASPATMAATAPSACG